MYFYYNDMYMGLFLLGMLINLEETITIIIFRAVGSYFYSASSLQIIYIMFRF